MKTTYIYFIILLSLSSLHSKAQNIDSLIFVTQQWKDSTLQKGIKWRKAHFDNLFKSKQVINIIEIDLSKKNLKKIGLEALSNSRKKTSFLADSIRALAAINGGFFDMKNGGAVDFIKVNEKVINYSKSNSSRANAYLAFDHKTLLISNDSTEASKFMNVMSSGPFLLYENKNIKLDKNAFNDNRHPRTAVAIKGNKLILLTVDGRNSYSEGLNLNELADIFRWYGCNKAMNLDGGGSTTMFISNQPNNGIVNYPSDNKEFDHDGERAVSNIIFIK